MKQNTQFTKCIPARTIHAFPEDASDKNTDFILRFHEIEHNLSISEIDTEWKLEDTEENKDEIIEILIKHQAMVKIIYIFVFCI